MARHTGVLATLTIANGAQVSSEYNSIAGLGSLVSVAVYAPAALTGAVTLQVSWLESPSASDWRNATYVTTAITVAAGAAVIVPAVGFRSIRLSSGSAEGAQRDFVIVGQFDMS